MLSFSSHWPLASRIVCNISSVFKCNHVYNGDAVRTAAHQHWSSATKMLYYSARGDVMSPAQRIKSYSLPSVFFLSLFFISEVISAVAYPIFASLLPNTCFRVSNARFGFQTSSYVLISQDVKARKNSVFLYFRWATSRFLSLRKNGLS